MALQKKKKNLTDDQTTQVIGLLNHCWLCILSTETLQTRMGLKYISHLWDFHPYWYLWFNDRAGVYRLELHGARPWEGQGWLAEFFLKYYPSESEPCFKGLSPLEQACRRSEIFQPPPAARSPGAGCPCHSLAPDAAARSFADLAQGTGAPAFNHQHLIPTDYFYAGLLLVAHHPQLGTLVRVKSQTRWQTVAAEALTFSDDRGHNLAVLKPGELVRDFPGFALSHCFYEKFIQAWTLFQQYPVCRELVWQGDGVRFIRDQEKLDLEVSKEIQVIVTQAELRRRAQDGLAPVAIEDLTALHLAT